MSPAPSADPRPSLRERKKSRTRFAIQQEALRLFGEQGYGATTVEQIAEAAEVSPSTVFRYFPTKDALVLTDDYDPVMVERFRAQPAELRTIPAFRAAFRETFTDLPQDQVQAADERNALILSVPELRAAFAEFMVTSMRQMADLVAERAGRSPGDDEVVAVTGALMGVLLSCFLLEGSLRHQVAALDAQLAHLETGFTL
jgi:AcrR family transcriptional regulator